jgi:FkbM family methyltransferase
MLSIFVKSLLMQIPPLYEAVQRYRDRKFHKVGMLSQSFAQHGEDVKLLNILRAAHATGKYIDIGCNHPFRLSNTYLLYLNGWRGLCIDALPRFNEGFKRFRPEDIFHCVAVGEEEGELPLFEFESDVLTTLDPELAKSYVARGHNLHKQSKIKVCTIDTVLETHKFTPPLSLLSLDIEGHELSALRSINLEYWRPEFICMEVLTADGHRNNLAIEYLIEKGYQMDFDLGLNMVFRRSVRSMENEYAV